MVTYKKLAEVFGVLEELCTERKIPYKIIHSQTWKSALNFGGYDYEVAYEGDGSIGGMFSGAGGAGGVTVVQNIYSEAKTAADLMQEAIYQQERAVLLGV